MPRCQRKLCYWRMGGHGWAKEPKTQVRVIDDFSISSVNGAFGFHNHLTLGGLDEVMALVTMLAINGGSGTIKDAYGEKGRVLCQLAVHPKEHWCSVIGTHSEEGHDGAGCVWEECMGLSVPRAGHCRSRQGCGVAVRAWLRGGWCRGSGGNWCLHVPLCLAEWPASHSAVEQARGGDIPRLNHGSLGAPGRKPEEGGLA
eukprot:70043-Amphidinium_carterae.2